MFSLETNTKEMITIPREEYEELKRQVNWLKEQLRVINYKQFVSKSEHRQRKATNN